MPATGHFGMAPSGAPFPPGVSGAWFPLEPKRRLMCGEAARLIVATSCALWGVIGLVALSAWSLLG